MNVHENDMDMGVDFDTGKNPDNKNVLPQPAEQG